MRWCVLSFATLCLTGFALAAPDSDLAVIPLSEIPAFDAEAPPEGPLPPVIADAIEHAKAALDSGNAKDALTTINNALAVSETSPAAALYYLALAHSKLGQRVDARITAQYAVSKSPHDPRINFLLGQLYFQQGHAEKAIRHLRRATLADGSNDPPPEWSAAWASLGDALVEEGYLRAAAEAYGAFDEAVLVEHREHREHPAVAAVLKRYPNGLLERRIELLRRAKLPQELVAATRDTLALRPDDLDVMRAHLRALLDAGEAQQAWEICERLFSRSEIPVGLLHIAAESAVATDQLDTWIERRLGNDAIDLPTKRRIAQIVTELGYFDAGARVYAAVVAADQADLKSAWSGAVCYLQAGEAPPAVNLLKRALQANPESATLPGEAFDRWVRLLIDNTELLGKVETTLNLSSADPFTVDTLRAIVAALQGKSDQAQALIAKTVDSHPKCLALQLYLPRIALAQYHWQAALDAVKPVLEAQSELAAAYAIQGIAADGLDQIELAKSALERAVDLAPQSTEYLLAVAHVYERQRAWISAQRNAQQAHELEPANGDALELAVKTYLSDGKFEIANQVVASADSALLPADALRRARLALEIAHRGFGEETRARLATLFKRYPNDVWIGRKLVFSLYVLDQLDEAYALAQDLHARFPQDEDAWYLLRELAASKLDYATAIPKFEAAVERYPNRRKLLTRLAQIYGADFQVEAERKTLDRLIALAPEAEATLPFWNQRVDTYVRFGDWDGALAELDRWPDDPRLKMPKFKHRLDVLMLADRHAESIKLVESALAELGTDAPERTQYRRWLIDALFDAQQYERALKLLDGYRDDEQDSLEWFHRTYLAQLELKQYDKAWALFNDYQPRDDYETLVFERMQAEVLSRRGDFDHALLVLEQALNRKLPRMDQDRTQVRIQIMATLADAKRGQEAIDRCLEWLDQLPPSHGLERIELLKRLAYIYQREGQMDAYTQTLSEWRTLQPSDPGVLNDLGYTWIDAGQHLEEATKMISKAVSLEPLKGAYLDSLGWAMYKQGEFADAVKLLERSSRLYYIDFNYPLYDPSALIPPDPIMYDHLGDALWRSGDHAAAQAAWQASLDQLNAEKRKAIDEPDALSDTARKLLDDLQTKLAAVAAGKSPTIAELAPEATE